MPWAQTMQTPMAPAELTPMLPDPVPLQAAAPARLAAAQCREHCRRGVCVARAHAGTHASPTNGDGRADGNIELSLGSGLEEIVL